MENLSDIHGLNSKEVLLSRELHGSNIIINKKERKYLNALISILKEPMVLLLLVTSIIYYAAGHIGDGIFLSIAIIFVSAIAIYQDYRSQNALDKLKSYTQSSCKLIRNGQIINLAKEEIVVGDYLMVEEGETIVADGRIIQSNDFSVDESILTGEAFPVFKNLQSENPNIYKGTTVTSGLAIAEIVAIGKATKIGTIGKSIEEIVAEKTPLELQINNFVQKMVIAGVVVFVVDWLINYFNTNNVIESLLSALTLAMSILPEEIPVAFSTFMALGAWRLMQMGNIVKHMKVVETLGSATVVCVDKTGTITENKMSIAGLYLNSTAEILNIDNISSSESQLLVSMAMWASEPIPFDPMEQALHESYSEIIKIDERKNYRIIHEYPLAGRPPMMTHVFENSKGKRIIAAKGAAEGIFAISGLSPNEYKNCLKAIDSFTKQGYRVLGVAQSNFIGKQFPLEQEDLPFKFLGLVAFYDPPKKNIAEVFQKIYKAGIDIKIITGDQAETTCSIANKIGFKGSDKIVSGAELVSLSSEKLKKLVLEKNIFARMFPEAKLKIINALKDNNEIVAMTGDGVNDGPALKAAHIGVAMGKRGTGVAKEAASLILTEDDLSSMVDAIAFGRKIYTNLKKAIRYIISIHIPIILVVFLPLALGWVYPNIFTPVHVIFLELIMGPTCSIVYENEPMEKNTMLQKPRPFTTTFFDWSELIISIVQGLFITIGALIIYRFAIYYHLSEDICRTMIFVVLISANIFLTLVNRSFVYSIFTTLSYKNKLIPIIIGITILLTTSILYIPFISDFFDFKRLSISQLCTSIFVGFTSVIWYEIVKYLQRSKSKNIDNNHI